MLHDEYASPGSSGLIAHDPLVQRFTSIFSYAWQWLYKDVTESEWQTERYPIKPDALWKLWSEVKAIVGVRFGKLSRYGLIDIDINSPYHPNQDPSAVPAIINALESIGIYRVLIVRSSNSDGLHLYIALERPISSYGLASALKFCCEDAGYNLAPGKLEIFPNCKVYRADGCTNYSGHRLPLQTGSYLLNSDYQPISNDLEFFLNAWDMAAMGNDLPELEQAIEKCKTRPLSYARAGRGERWREDCQQAIATGWTEHGQTNELIGTIAQYGRVFLGLAGDELTQWMIATAIAAPGYSQWCRHQHQITRRCREWAKEVEGYYFPYPSSAKPRSRSATSPWSQSKANEKKARPNEKKAEDARSRIQFAYDSVKSLAFSTVADLASSIVSIAKCSLTTLYKNRAIWHPESMECNTENPYTEPNTATIDEIEKSESSSPKISEPLSDGLLHTEGPKKGLDRPLDFLSDQTSEKTHLQPPNTARGFDFCDRGAHSPPSNRYQEEDCVDYPP